MFPQFCVLALLSMIAVASLSPQRPIPNAQPPCSEDRAAWVAQELQKMQTIKPGMTREQLLTVFTTEGGLSTGLHRIYVSKDCPNFKVDVEFRAVGRPDRDADGRVTLVEDNRDTIATISRPYLEFGVAD
jgi:hypothetical protein